MCLESRLFGDADGAASFSASDVTVPWRGCVGMLELPVATGKSRRVKLGWPRLGMKLR